MSKSVSVLKWLLLIGALYFLGVAIAHMLRIKVPLLFIYFDLPSYGYQDRIISFFSFGWSMFMFVASLDPVKNRESVKAIIIATVGFSCIVPGCRTFCVPDRKSRAKCLCGRLDLQLFSFRKTGCRQNSEFLKPVPAFFDPACSKVRPNQAVTTLDALWIIELQNQ
jgi:hypothetical protein